MADFSFSIGVPAAPLPPGIDPNAHALDPIDFLQDADGDIDITTGDLQFSAGLAGVAVAQRQNLQFCLGEDFTDLAQGLDYYGSILIKSPNLMLIRQLIAEQIAAAPYTTAVDVVQLSLGDDRELRASVRSTCNFGSVLTQAELTTEAK